MANETHLSLDACFARISFRQGMRSAGPCGAGVVLRGGIILTCTHVITDAFGLKRGTQEKPTGKVTVDFPLAGGGQSFQSEIVFWDADPNIDLAGLKPDDPLPPQVRPTELKDSSLLWGETIKAFGFPLGHTRGTWAEGVIRGPVEHGWIEVFDPGTTAYFIQPGFSGGPIWSTALNGCLGIIIAADNDLSKRIAYMVPASIVRGQLKDLPAEAISQPIDPWAYIDDIESAFNRAIERELAMHIEKYFIEKNKPEAVGQEKFQNYFAILYMSQEIDEIRRISSDVDSFALEIEERNLSKPLAKRLDAILARVTKHLDLNAELLTAAGQADPGNYLGISAGMLMRNVEDAMSSIDGARIRGNRDEIFNSVETLGQTLFELAGCFQALYDDLEKYLPH